MKDHRNKEKLWPDSPFQKKVFRKRVVAAQEKAGHANTQECGSKDILHKCKIEHIEINIKSNDEEPKSKQHRYSRSPQRFEANACWETKRSEILENLDEEKEKETKGRDLDNSKDINEDDLCHINELWGEFSPMKRIKELEGSDDENIEGEKNCNNSSAIENENCYQRENLLENISVKENEILLNSLGTCESESNLALSYAVCENVDKKEDNHYNVGVANSSAEISVNVTDKSPYPLVNEMTEEQQKIEKLDCPVESFMNDIKVDATIQKNHCECSKELDLETNEKSLGNWVFVPISKERSQILGNLKNADTGEVINIYLVNQIEDLEKSSYANNSEMSWCSVYVCLRIIGLFIVGISLALIITQAVP